MVSAIVLFACTLFVFANAQSNRPTVSETFKANCVVFLRIEQIPVSCWITQGHSQADFAFTSILPKGHHQFPLGGIFKQVVTANKWYTVYPTAFGNPFCECFYGPYKEYWWWIPDTHHVPYPPAGTDLDCWYVGELIDEGICVQSPNDTLPMREYKEIIRLSVEFIQYTEYMIGVANTSMLGVPPECADTICV